MRRLILFSMLACLAGHPACTEALEWLTDAQAAQEQAKQENKFILLDFTGSDWCGWCMKLKSEVFDKPEFADFAQAKLVMVEVDFPHHKSLAQAQKEANEGLGRKYHIRGYPTIIVLGPDGEQVGQMGYVSGGPSAFLAKFEQVAKISHQAAPTPPPPDEPQPPRKPVTFKPLPPAIPIHYGALALKGISGTKDRRIVLINNASMMAGETSKVHAQDHLVVVCCKEIREDSVLITCDGTPMELKLANR